MPAQTTRPDAAVDAAHCPLCGADNTCAMAAAPAQAGDAHVECWCMASDIAPGVLDRIPPGLRGQACICARCARG